MREKILQFIRTHGLIGKGDTVLAGVSGGADSVCLFFMLLELLPLWGARLSVLHVHHGLRESAAADELFVRRLCGEYGVEYQAAYVDVNACRRQSGASVEEAARELRLGALIKRADEIGAQRIALAHNCNDQAETVLYRMFRGTGSRGIGGIAAERDRFIRPLLTVERREIEAYLAERGITYCTDETNLCDDYARNVIRHHILPEAEKLNSAAVRHIAAAADNVRMAEDFIHSCLEKTYGELVQKDEEGLAVRVMAAQALHPYLRSKLLYRMLSEAAGRDKDLSAVHIGELEGLLGKQSGRRVSLPYQLYALRTGELLKLGKEREEAQGNEGFAIELAVPEGEVFREYRLSNGGILQLFVFQEKEEPDFQKERYTKYFDYDMIERSLLLRNRRSGDYLRIDRAGHTCKLKKYMIDAGIPLERRDRLPLVCAGDEVLWVIGYRRGEAYPVTEATKRILRITYRGGDE